MSELFLEPLILQFVMLKTAVHQHWMNQGSKALWAWGSSKINQFFIFQKNIRVAWNLFVIWVVFLLCWMPIVLTAKFDDYRHVSGSVYHILMGLAMMNSVVNFLLYGYYNSNFRKAYFSLLKCKTTWAGSHSNKKHYINMIKVSPWLMLFARSCNSLS